ncbi:galactokinase [Jatrophihabitans fulvus]
MSAVVWRAPGRVNLIGEHTDYNDGFVLPFALPLGVTAAVSPREDDVVTVRSDGWDDTVELRSPQPGSVDGWAAYAAGAVWACDAGGADVHLSSDLPVGAGLSSSAAVECAVVGALAEARALGLTPAELVRRAHRAETEFVGVPVGVLDQSAVVHASEGHALFLDTRSGEHRPVPLPLADAGLAVLVMDTRAPHRLVDGEYARRRAECERACAELGVPALRDADADAVATLADDTLRRRARHIVTENARVLDTVARLESGDVRGIADLLTASHASLRDDYEVSSRELDLAVDTALGSGALGARMTGGGFGGSAVALLDSERADAVGEAVAKAFADAGFAAPHCFAVVPSEGAHPVR